GSGLRPLRGQHRHERQGSQRTRLHPGTRRLAPGPCRRVVRTGRDRLAGMTGRLVLGGAPLGQPGDVGPRLREVMASADVLAVEDTRRLHRLASDLGVTFTGRVVTFHESVEQARLPGLLAALTDGATVLLLTDA